MSAHMRAAGDSFFLSITFEAGNRGMTRPGNEQILQKQEESSRAPSSKI